MGQFGREEIIDSRRIFSGRIVTLDHAEVRLPDGGSAMREIVRHPMGACCVAVSPEGLIYMVEQFRIPMDESTLELPAGKVDPGEEPVDAVRRELTEEIGMMPAGLDYVCAAAVSPGFCDEKVYIYVGYGLSPRPGRPDDDEFLNVSLCRLDDLLAMIADGRIYDAKTIIGILYAARHREKYGIV